MKKEGAFIYQGEFSLEGEWPTLYEETHKDHLKSSVANMGGGKVRGRQNNSAWDGLGTQSSRPIVFSSENPNILQFFLWKVWICQDHPKSTRNWIFIASRTSFGVLLGFQLPWETCTSGSREGCPG